MKLTLIVPIYNAENFIRATLESVIASIEIDTNEFECLLINECIHPVTTEIENLEDGEYEGYRYEYWFELKNGFKFKTKTGVRVSRKFAALKLYKVENGEITEVI